MGTVVFETENEEPRTYKLSVIGKYSNLACTTDVVEFPYTTVGKIINRKVIIKNTSVVPSVFTIKN